MTPPCGCAPLTKADVSAPEGSYGSVSRITAPELLGGPTPSDGGLGAARLAQKCRQRQNTLAGGAPVTRKLVLLGGPTGVGKSSVLRLLAARLPKSGVLDADDVWRVSGDLATEHRRPNAIANVAVLIAAAGVLGSGSGWPDWAVAGVLAGLALTSGVSVVKHARREILDGSCESASSPDARTAR